MTDQLTLDFANCFADRVGDQHGLQRSAWKDAAPERQRWTDSLERTRGSVERGEAWRLLPYEPTRSAHVTAVHDLVRRLRPNTDNLIVLGIGGSALGNIALQNALNPPTYNLMPRSERPGPRLFVLDNVDPTAIGHVFAEVKRTDPAFTRTIVNVISKSGETAETAAQFMIARNILRQHLGEDEYARQIVAITDPEQGTMRSICDREGIVTLPVPEGVGGRFSVLSPVGLFSAAMCGIDVDGLLDGARAMDERCRADADNPAAMLAWGLVELGRRWGKINHVLMPYSNALYSLADWFRQLWAESLGKKVDNTGREVFAGFTPIKALGTTDQHSQVQLYREGPNDKVIGFIEVGDFGDDDVTVPPSTESNLNVDALSYLEGKSLAGLLNAEKRATEYALVESQRPNFTIHMPRIDAQHVGEFLQLWQVATAYAGLMLNINTYDQPAVETGKLATFGLMGREGYGEWKTKVQQTLG